MTKQGKIEQGVQTEEGAQANSPTLLVNMIDGSYNAPRTYGLLPGERKVFRVDLQSGIEVVLRIFIKTTT